MSEFALQFIPGEEAEGEPPKKPRSFWDAVMDNVVGRDDGVMSFGEQLGTAMNMGGEAATFGVVGDEAAAAADAMIGRGSYKERLEKYRDDENQLWKENPVGAAAYTFAPAMLTGGAGAKAVAATPTLAGKMATSGVLGALGGGTYGFMEGEGGLENRKSTGATGATVGGTVGLAAPGIARVAGALTKAAGDRSARRALVRSAQSMDELADKSQAAYARADKAAPIPRTQFAQASDDILQGARDAGYNPKLQPKSQVVMEEIADAANIDRGQNIGFRELETLRRQAQSPAGMMSDRSEQMVGSRIIEGIDDFVANSPTMGKEATEARRLWTALRQTELLETAMEKARNSASGFENGLRVEFRRILNNPKLSRGMSGDTIKAMQDVVRGTPASNFLKKVGRMMGPGIDAQSNMLGLGLSAGAGGAVAQAVGLPWYVGAAVPPIVGRLAQGGAQSLTRQQAEVARALAATGGKLPQATERLSPVVRALLLGGGATSGGMLGSPQ